jgi:hypothetical protein
MDIQCPAEAELRHDFSEWRSNKHYRHQKVPINLMARAQLFSDKYGPTKAREVTGLSRSYFGPKSKARVKGNPGQVVVKNTVQMEQGGKCSIGYTKIEMIRPGEYSPIEFESPQGFKLRIATLSGSAKDALNYFYEAATR